MISTSYKILRLNRLIFAKKFDEHATFFDEDAYI